MDKKKKLTGLILCSAVADAIGLPREGLTPKKSRKIFGDKIQPALVVIPFYKRFTTCSDDTEHLWITAKALLSTIQHDQKDDEKVFEKKLASLLKKWGLALPVGAGMATLKACFKLLVGIPPKKSGVYSAGNGATMRAPIIGAFYANDSHKMARILKISTFMTHTDPKAYEGAWVIAKASSLLMNGTIHSTLSREERITTFFSHMLSEIKGEELKHYLSMAQTNLLAQEPLSTYLNVLDLSKKGITGYVNHTVPCVIYAWLHFFGDYQATIESLIKSGGDTDSTAAIAGALVGITTGIERIPNQWIKGVYNSPITLEKLTILAEALTHHEATQKNDSLPHVSFLCFMMRNIGMLFIVLFHGFRRLLPF